MEACGGPTTTAAPGRRSSTTSRPARSGPSRSPRPIPRSSTSAAAKDCSGPTSPPATASTSRPTAARPGGTSGCATRSRFRRSPWTRKTPTGSSSPCWATRTDRTRSAACSVRSMEERHSRRCSTWTRIPARPTCCSTRRIPAPSMQRCGSRARARGRTATSKVRAAVSTNRPTAALPGASSRRDCRTSSMAAWGASGSASRPPRPSASSPPWPQRSAVACTAPTTRARAGRASPTTIAWRSAPTTSPR